MVRYDGQSARGSGDAGVQTLSALNLQAAAGFLRAARAAEFASASHREFSASVYEVFGQ
jgi:hypothetical protein